jgi:hypothetical protein
VSAAQLINSVGTVIVSFFRAYATAASPMLASSV